MGKPVVLVTGASAGIGAALARRLARDRRDLVLTARRTDRLESLARELHDGHGVHVEVVPADLGQPGAGGALAAEVARRGLVVEWLVNNAGFGTAGRFDRLPLDRELEEVRVNVKAPVELAGHLLPDMVRRGHGALVNVASVVAFGPMGYMATYCATKAFVLAWSEALAVELRGTGVDVLCVCPGFTATEFQAVAGVKTAAVPRFMWMTADDVADQAVRAVGRQTVLVNGTLNALTTVGMRLAPRSLIARVTASANAGRTGGG